MARWILFLIAICSVSLGLAQASLDTNYVRSHYIKTEHYITMRDGVKLFTAVYTPRATNVKYPIIMQRTPYSCRPYGVDNYRLRIGPNEHLMKGQYIFVYQDVRGRYKSGGQFIEMTPFIPNKQNKKQVDESTDTYDTIEWLLKNTANNGNVGMQGISFPGFYTTAALPDAHPALKAASPQAPMSDEFIGDDCYHNGAFFLMDNFGFYSRFDGPRNEDSTSYLPFFNYSYQDAYSYFLKMGPLQNVNNDRFFYDSTSTWRQTVKNDTYGEFWKTKNIRQHLKNIKPAVLVVGGWFDAEDLFGALKTFSALQKLSPKNNHRLVMGPWTHGGWAAPSWTSFSDYHFGDDLNQYFQKEIETPFFDYYLKNKGTFNLGKVTLFETGSNQWKSYNNWPAETASVNYFFHSNGKLSTVAPSETSGSTAYLSDPNNPVPYSNGIRASRNNAYMAEDQRFAAQRPDVVVFETDTLENDLLITGEIGVNLCISLTGTDADFVVKLIDVWPENTAVPDEKGSSKPMDGYQQLVRAEVFRGKFRKSFEKPEAFTPNKPDTVSFQLNEAAHTFKKGHKIMIQVQISWFPLVDRNPQKFGFIPNMNADDFTPATIQLFHNSKNASYVTLPVLK